MKKIFKMFTVAFVALTTFVSAGCSCSLNNAKAKERIAAYEKTEFGKKGETNLSYVVTYKEVNNQEGTSAKLVYTVDHVKSEETIELYEKKAGEEETKVETDEAWKEAFEFIIASGLPKDAFSSKYNSIKDQPGVVYGIVEKLADPKLNFRGSADYYAEAKKLYGLEDKVDSFLSNLTFDCSARKTFFNQQATIVIEYDIELASRYRHTYVLNKDNMLTSYKLEELTSRVVNFKTGERESVVYLLETFDIVYK